jgi:AsmA-like C-terminal region
VNQSALRLKPGEGESRKTIWPGLTVIPAGQQEPQKRKFPRWLAWVGLIVAATLVLLGIAAEYVARNAEPILRRRVIASLEERFRSSVELDALHISVMQGLEVSGSGLRILSIAGPSEAGSGAADAAPMVSVKSFEFHTGIRQLLEPTMRVNLVRVQGMRLNIPPKQSRGPLFTKDRSHQGRPKTSIVVDRIMCSDTTLTIETNRPGKLPLVFAIGNVTLQDVGANRPMLFEASLVNPKPVGDIRSTGHFGPWHEDEPRDTPVYGVYSFTHADLKTIKGIGGTLSSTGKYGGTLGEIGVVGTTETPDFSLDVSERPVDLKTEFDATVDGTTGDTKLNSVRATMLHTVLRVSGTVIRAGNSRGQAGTQMTGTEGERQNNVSGHFIDLSVVSDQARVEDILRLAAKTSPPVMRGALTLRAHLSIPPGKISVSKKMRVEGRFAIRGASFGNPKWQEAVNTLSMRASGNPEQANSQNAARVTSEMGGSFVLANAMVDVPELNFKMPGAEVNLAGKYSLDGETFDFGGTVRTKATASGMLTGWKSILAIPFDPLLKKHGAGLEVPVKISGTRSEPKLGLDLGKLAGEIFGRNKKQIQKGPAQHP